MVLSLRHTQLWDLSSKTRNRLAHLTYGNTSVAAQSNVRTRWESTTTSPGIEILHPDELALPVEAMLNVLRPDQVSQGAEGVALCNSMNLEPKLQVQGGSYLALIIPGKLGHDLRTLIQAANPALIANCFECHLSFKDPATERRFPRSVVIVNLGQNPVKPNALKASVKPFQDSAKVLWLHAYQKWCPEEWNSTLGADSSLGQKREKIRQRVATLLKQEPKTIDMWSFSCTTDSLHACVRIADKQVSTLLNSRDTLLFFRPFVAKGEVAAREDGITIMWASRFKSLSELQTVANTLAGVAGFVANAQGLGVRISIDHVAAARKVLQPTLAVNQQNAHVAGLTRFLVQGLPKDMSAEGVTFVMANPSEGSNMEAWHIIPFKRTAQSHTCSWIVKADKPPKTERLVLEDGYKVLISKLPSPSEVLQQKQEQRRLEAELSKAQRRDQLTSKEPETVDPWSDFLKSRGMGSGKGASKSTDTGKVKGKQGPASANRPETQTQDAEVKVAVSQLRKEVDAMHSRLDKQEARLDAFGNKLESNHNEVMLALRSLGAASDSSDRKRSADMGSTPLKAIAGGRGPKDQKP